MDVKDTNIPQILDSAVIMKQLVKKQRKKIPSDKKLAYKDIKRIVKYITSSIFTADTCCLWDGYVTNSKPTKNHKGAYINFYFKKKKVALHRLLYINFKGHITDNDFIKYTCDNKGQCCNINHMIKIEYSTQTNKQQTKEKEDIKEDLSDSSGEEKFTVNFN